VISEFVKVPTTMLIPFLASLLSLLSSSSAELSLPPAEQTAAYTVLETINPSINWRSLYPDDLCVSGPHGIVCDFFTTSCNSTSSDCTYTTSIHIVELNFGYVSDFTPNPTCNFTSSNSISLFKLFSSFPFLKKLFFFNCFISPNSYTALPPNLFALLPSTLEELVLINNPSLSGLLEMDASILPLRRLVITGTAISCEIPLLPPTLHQLVLSRNNLYGQIPPSISNCTNIKIIDLSYNHLTGPIPDQLTQLLNLVKLDLGFNSINGRIPDQISDLKKLELLDLSYNLLTDGLPSGIGEMVSLKEVYLSGNQRIGGQIPEIWEKIGGNLLGIGFSNLGLVGSIPVSMGVFLKNLCYLALDNNLLEGPVPVQFKRLESTAREVNLERNRLHGPVPFSPDFVARMGSKLKLGGNRGLCIVGSSDRKMKGGLEILPVCNGTEMPIPVVPSSAGKNGFSEKMVLWGLMLLFGLVL
jgi:Leucine rich repeat